MSEMYMSRAQLEPSELSVREARSWSGDSYRQHQWIWRFFEKDADAKRDFIFRIEEGAGLTVYLVSRRPPVALAPWRVETKPYAPRLKAGDRLGFKVRVNPVIKVKIGHQDNARKTARHRRDDVVQALRYKAQQSGSIPDPRPVLAQRAGGAWIAARAEAHGFAIAQDGIAVAAYQRHRSWKKARQGKDHELRFSTLDLNGVLEVRDPALFVESTLFAGLGPAKSLGCGLMLVRPV